MPSPDYSNQAHRFALRGMDGSDFLAFRCVADRRMITNCSVLDIGCGTGRSSRFLAALGNQVTGVDVSLEMIEHAKSADSEGDYRLVSQSEPLPFSDQSFDAFFSSWMVLEHSTLESLTATLREANRVLQSGGDGVVITNTPEFYRGNWVSCQINFEENCPPLQSGQQVKACLLPEGVVVTDFFWSDADYKQAFKESGFRLLEEMRPLGRSNDSIAWQDELTMAPYVVYRIRKT